MSKIKQGTKKTIYLFDIFVHDILCFVWSGLCFFCILDLAQGRSYWNRLRFLDLCDITIDLFSKSYFCKHFLIPALELVSDPVANVRWTSFSNYCFLFYFAIHLNYITECFKVFLQIVVVFLTKMKHFGRYKLCYMLPKLRSTIRPTEKHLLQQLEFCVRKLLCREKDKDVVVTLRKVRKSLLRCISIGKCFGPAW